MKRAMVGIGLAGALALAGCGGDDGSSDRVLSGTFTLTDSSEIGRPSGAGGPCYGTGGYDDIESGLRVVVNDGEGKTLATGRLGTSSYEQNPQYPILGECVFPIEVPEGLPRADFYSIEVGSRGELTYSYDEMEANGWTVSFSLG
jgi:hypothetical protein